MEDFKEIRKIIKKYFKVNLTISILKIILLTHLRDIVTLLEQKPSYLGQFQRYKTFALFSNLFTIFEIRNIPGI